MGEDACRRCLRCKCVVLQQFAGENRPLISHAEAQRLESKFTQHAWQEASHLAQKGQAEKQEESGIWDLHSIRLSHM